MKTVGKIFKKKTAPVPVPPAPNDKQVQDKKKNGKDVK